MDNVQIFAGNSHPELAKLIAKHLLTDVSDAIVNQFNNTETHVEIKDSVNNKDVFIVQTGHAPINDHLMEALLMCDACRRANAKTITLIMPCYPYARQDRKDKSRVPISASVVAKQIEAIGTNNIITVELHAGQIQGMFGKVINDNLYLERYMIDICKGFNEGNVTIVSPDVGGAKRAKVIANKLDRPLVLINKERKKAGEVDNMTIIGDPNDVNDEICILVDDMADTCGTLCKAAEALKEIGAKEIYAIVGHGIFSSNACEKINNCEALNKVFYSNTLPKCNKSEKLEQYDISELLAKTIKFNIEGKSVSELFD